MLYVEVITIQCPKCKGELHVDKDTKQCFCVYCRTEVVVKKDSSSSSVTLDSLVKRGFLSLEYSDWSKAEESFDHAANIDPEHGMIYVGKLLAELEMTKEEELASHDRKLSGYTNYKKAIRFADSELKVQLEKYNNKIKKRIADAKAKEERKLAEAEKERKLLAAEQEKQRQLAEAEREKQRQLAEAEREKQRQLRLERRAENAPKRRKFAILMALAVVLAFAGIVIVHTVLEQAEARRVVAEQERIEAEAEAWRQAIKNSIDERIETGYEFWHELVQWASEQDIPWGIFVNEEQSDQELMVLIEAYGIHGNYIEATPLIRPTEDLDEVILALHFESATYREAPAELSQLNNDSEDDLNEWLEDGGAERAEEEFNEVRIIIVDRQGNEIIEDPEFGKEFVSWEFEIDQLASFEDTFLHIKWVYRDLPGPSPTDMLADDEVQRALIEYTLNLDFSEVIAMIDEYLEENFERDNDATYEIRELATRGIELLEHVDLVVDDFDGQVTVYYSGVREIGSTVNIIPYIRPGEVGYNPRFANAHFHLSMGFYRDDWLFFDRTELRMSDGFIREWNHSSYDTHTDVIDGGTVREMITLEWSLANARTGTILYFRDRMNVNYDHVLRFRNRDTDENLDFTLSNAEISALTILAEIFNIMGILRETITNDE